MTEEHDRAGSHPLKTIPSTAATDKRRMSAADRRSQPSFHDIAVSAAQEHGVCVRPLVMQAINTETGGSEYVAVPCKSTLESQCEPCAKRARNLRMQQLREGWHLDEEPVQETNSPTEFQRMLLGARADLLAKRSLAIEAGDDPAVAELAAQLESNGIELRASGMRGRIPPVDSPECAPRRRSTRRRQDAPDLPSRQVRAVTVGHEFAGRFRPSMFLTLTCDSYGAVRDGAPVDPANYDYRRAARDAVHFSALVDRFIQNLRRALGWDVQYFATVEPQKRAAPHLHAALRGAIPHEVTRKVVAATYHQVWWPPHDDVVYACNRDENRPVWNRDARTFVDPTTSRPLKSWAEALDNLTDDPDAQPAHVVRFGTQCKPKGILGGTEEAGRHIGYLTKYLTKSISDVIKPQSTAQRAHHDRLHTELTRTPCSPKCPIWLCYGIIPSGATGKTVPGSCKGRAHRRSTLGLPGRRVLVSRKWTGKTLPDHQADRAEFVRQLLAEAGVNREPQYRGATLVYRCRADDQRAPRRDELIMRAVAQRIAWRAEYDMARLKTGPPATRPESTTDSAA